MMDKRLRAYKTKLVLNNHEAFLFMGCAGFSRFIFNWGLSEWKRQYEAGEKPSAYGLKKQFNAIKDDRFAWAREYPYVIEQEAFDHLGKAFQNFFRRVKAGDKPGYPKFKKRGKHDAFSVRGSIGVESSYVKLPRIGWTRLAESDYLPTQDVKILSATVSRRASDWYISLQVEEDVPELDSPQGEPIGIDVGIKSLAVFSDGTQFDNPRTLERYEKRLTRLQRELSRRQKGSKNREKTKRKIAELHQRIADTRSHVLHDISKHAVKSSPRTIVIEDLNVRGMTQNHHLAKAVADASMSELHRQIGYKADWRGSKVMTADRWFPSSKLCSQCGSIKEELSLDERIYVCECGNVIDRDLNAALNLAALARTSEAGGIACGVEVT